MNRLTSINPATDELIESFDIDSEQKVENSLSRSNRRFQEWKKYTIEKKIGHLHAVAGQLRQHAGHYARTMTLEMGKPITEAMAEVEKCALLCDYYAANAARFLAPEDRPSPFQNSMVQFEPLGTILAVMPWNFPFWQVFRAAIPALMAGNTMLLKHASNVSRCALQIEEVFLDAGIPDGVFSTLLLPASRIETVIPHIAGVTLTGSENAGRSLGALAGKYLKPAVLELGGSDPFIVFADADIDSTAAAAVQARCVNSGQSCIAAKRFIVHESIYLDFLDSFRAKMEALKIGNPLLTETQVGPLARNDLREELHALVLDATAKGARLVLGGKPTLDRGSYYAPTIIDQLTEDMALFHEETFGPVAAVYSFSTDKEAVDLANRSRFGLGASIWTANMELAASLVSEIEAGCVFINATVRSDPALPFGGVKDSGYGRELSLEGIRSFVNVKTVRHL